MQPTPSTVVSPLWTFFALLLLTTCQEQSVDSLQEKASLIAPKYARGFEIESVQGITLLRVLRPWPGAQRNITYALAPQGMSLPRDLEYDVKITTPVTNLVVTSTSHIPALDLLGVSHYLSGFPQTQYISSPAVRARIDADQVKDIGAAQGINYEALMALQPQLVMTYQSGGDQSELEALDITGIPVVLNSEFLEETPLGRAEWIKFSGHLLGKSPQADSIFQVIESNYLESLNRVDAITRQPTVFSGTLYEGTWYAPGGKSFVAQFIEDAGGLYVWNNNSETGSLELSFEAVIENTLDSDYWVGVGQFTTVSELLANDTRFERLGAVQNRQIYNYHRRLGATGGFEYLELGGARPDLVLKDFIKILHPQLMTDHQFYFFKKLDP